MFVFELILFRCIALFSGLELLRLGNSFSDPKLFAGTVSQIPKLLKPFELNLDGDAGRDDFRFL